MTKWTFDLMQGTENSASIEKREPNGHKYRQKELLGDTSTNQLEDIGFDTTPFECSFEEQE